MRLQLHQRKNCRKHRQTALFFPSIYMEEWCRSKLTILNYRSITKKCRVLEGSVNKIHWTLMPKDCWIKWDLVVCIRVFSDRSILKGALRSFDVNCHHGTRLWHSTTKSEARESRDVGTSYNGLSLCNDEKFAWWSVTHSGGIGKWGRQHRNSYKSYLSG
jgi:hypothetical protein